MSGRRRRAVIAVGSKIRKQVPVTLLAGVVLILLLSAMGSWGTARANPNVSCGPCGCGGCGGTCPSGTSLGLSASIQANVTNATITVQDTSSGSINTAFVNVSFGLNTSYSFPAVTNLLISSTGPGTFVNYLEPGTKYFYKAVGWTECYDTKWHLYHGSLSGNWTTLPELNYYSAYGDVIKGTVTDSNGTKAVQNLEVEVQCTNYTASDDWSASGATNSSGAYYININYLGSPACSAYHWGYFVVQVINGFGSERAWWVGHWNETIVVWAPQVVNFVLPLNFVKYSVVQVQDYSNAKTANGYPNSTISYISGSSYTTFSSHCWTALFLFSGCSEGSNTIGTSSTWSAIGHNLVITQNLWESGTVLFDAMARTACITAENYYAAEQPPVVQPATWPSGDNITMADAASNSSIYPIYSWGAGDGDQGRLVYSTTYASGSVTVSSTSTTTGLTKGFNVALGIDIYGVDLSTTLATDQWSQTSTYTTTDTLSWTVYGNSVTVPICYAVYGVGGSSTSASQSTADAIGVWAFAPSLSGGQYSCPATQ